MDSSKLILYIKIIFIFGLVHHSVYGQLNRENSNSLEFEDNGNFIVGKVRGRPVFQYNYAFLKPDNPQQNYYKRNGFIHPVYSPKGGTITEGFPKNHAHHHGMFNAWVNTRFKGEIIDFWNIQDGLGTVVFKEVLGLVTYRDYGILKVKHHHLAFIKGDSIPVLEEIWKIKLYNSSDPFIWDITIEQKNISMSNFEILKYHYGGLAFRGRDEWNKNPIKKERTTTDSCNFNIITNSQKTRIEGNHTIPKWVNMYGRIGYDDMSLTVIPLSNNSKFPDYVRIHPDLPYFCFTPVVKNGFTLKPSEMFITKYRIIADNEPINYRSLKALNKMIYR
tara:strand:- start:28689 stop:29687 length:999 start_codon:yes stop_codon:yes gene_type:complete